MSDGNNERPHQPLGLAKRGYSGVIQSLSAGTAGSALSDVELESRLMELGFVEGARVEILEGDDPVTALLEFARSRGITQLFIGHSQRTGLLPRLKGNPVHRLIQTSRGMDVRVFPQ